MFGDLPKIFDRNFVIGFFLPAAAFVAASFGLLDANQMLPKEFSFEGKTLETTTVLGVIAWLMGVALLVLNYDIYRLMEGYGKFNPARLLRFKEMRAFKNQQESLSSLDEEILSFMSAQEDIPAELLNRRAALLRTSVERFPQSEAWVLPTAFGNVMRAFESYSKNMYGLDAIPGWSRLYAVIPKDYRELIDTAKAQTDFWINLWVVSFLFLIEYLWVVAYTRRWSMSWIMLVVVSIALWSNRARAAALDWGDMVKASFDVYLPDLHSKMCLSPPNSKKEERDLWEGVSRAMIYADPSELPARVLPSKGAAGEKQKK